MKKKMLIEEKIIAIILYAMVLMVAAQVLSRYILHRSLSHTEELVRYCFVWVTFLGASSAVFRGKHLSIAGAIQIVPAGLVKYMRLLTGISAVVFACLLAFYGMKIVILQFQTVQTTAALGLPMWIIGLAVPVCSFALVIRIAMGVWVGGDRND